MFLCVCSVEFHFSIRSVRLTRLVLIWLNDLYVVFNEIEHDYDTRVWMIVMKFNCNIQVLRGSNNVWLDLIFDQHLGWSLIHLTHRCVKSLRKWNVVLYARIFRNVLISFFFVHRRHQYSDCWILCIMLFEQVTEDSIIKEDDIKESGQGQGDFV